MIQKLLAYIKDLVDNRFYGKLILSFESGKIVHLKKEENIKLSE